MDVPFVFLETKLYGTYPIACPESHSTVTSELNFFLKVFHISSRHYPPIERIVILVFYKKAANLKLVYALMPSHALILVNFLGSSSLREHTALSFLLYFPLFATWIISGIT